MVKDDGRLIKVFSSKSLIGKEEISRSSKTSGIPIEIAEGISFN